LNSEKTKLPEPALTVLYDGDCPLCSREIAWYRRRQGVGRIRWLDASQRDCPLPGHLSRKTALARFHVFKSDGSTLSGASAFIELWSHIPSLRWVARGVRDLRLAPLLEWGYQRFLPLRGRLARALFRSPP
jgi:predicted DCC family thiol-disulfide oxidoreductase YuxK